MITNIQEIQDVLVWRGIAWKRHYGHWEVLFDDPMLCNRAGDFLLEAQAQGAERITFHLLGAYKNVTDMNFKPMHGSVSIKSILKNTKIEEYA